MKIQLIFRESVKDYIVEKGFDDKYGARPLRRAIQSRIEDPLADEMLQGTVKSGDTVSVGVNRGTVRFHIQGEAQEKDAKRAAEK